MDDQNYDEGRDSKIIIYLLFAIILYITDFLITKFNGLDFFKVLSNINSDILKTFFLAPTVLILLVIYILNQKKWDVETLKDIISFTLLILLINIIFWWGGGFNIGNILHLGFAFLIYYDIIKPKYVDRPYIGTTIIILLIMFDFFILSWIYSAFSIFIKLFPVWFYVVYFFTMPHRSKVPLIFATLVTLFFLFSLASSSIGMQNFSKTMDPDQLSNFQEMIDRFKENIVNSILGIGSGMYKIYNETSAIYQEEYYTGEIDQNAQVELGVFIEDLEGARPTFFIDEPINIWATLVVKTIKSSIDVNTSCVANYGQSNEIKPDKLRPEFFTAAVYDKVSLDCIFNKNVFRAGSHRISIKTTFDFQTQAYQKKYFINKETSNSFARENRDPLSHYGIHDKNPLAIYTSGPLKIGMDSQNSLIRVETDEKDDQFLTIGITLSNNWQGKIDGINQLIISIPDSMELDGYECSGYNFTPIANIDGSKSYELNEKINEISQFLTLRCPLKITNKQNILGDAPLSIRYFKVFANYTYTLEKFKEISVIESDKIKKLRELTKNTDPFFEIPYQTMNKNTSLELDLNFFSYDTETTDKNLFHYELLGQTNTSIVKCKKVNRHYLECESYNNTGFNDIRISVNDLAKTTTTTFRICVNNESLCKPEETNNEENNNDNDNKNQGPILIKSIEKHSFIYNQESAYYINAGNYIKDGDEKTEIVDMTFRFPLNDQYIVGSSAKQGNNIIITFLYRGSSSCINLYNYEFNVSDRDNNQEIFIFPFNITGCS
jgi:hypothetical protein